MPDTSSPSSDDRRAQGVCGFGLAVQLLAFGMILWLAIWSRSEAVWAEATHLGFGAAIWLALLILHTQRKRSAAESFETAELRRAVEAGTHPAIFEAADESLHLERQRLQWVYRWFLPGFAIVLAALHIGLYVRWHTWFARPLTDPNWPIAENPALAATLMAFAGFFCFMLSRYASGMARQTQWRTLRAAATYLAGNALACLVVVAAMGFSILEKPYAEPVAAYAIRIAMLVLGIEFAINFVLDVYRPRTAEEHPRPSFDSRLLALISEPGGLARSLADTINYQFGFEVSGTWFYQLLQRAFLPLAVFTMVCLFALSSVVIVDVDQEVIVEHFGQPTGETPLQPGIHFKWPWPIDSAYRQPTARMQQLLVGSRGAEEEDPEADPDAHEHELILWTEKHEFTPHLMIMVASPDRSGGSLDGSAAGEEGSRTESSGVGLLECSIAIEYRIDNLHDYLYRYQDPVGIMESVTFQTLTDYAASVDIDEIISRGREQFEQGLSERIQQRIDELQLGIRIAFLGLHDAHPPAERDVAKAYQDVVAQERRTQALVEHASGQAQEIKTKVAGSVERADELDAAIVEMDRLASDPQAGEEDRAAARRLVDALLLGDPKEGIKPMTGQASARIANAEADAVALLSEAESKARVFGFELAAYQAAPRLYRTRKALDMWTRAVEGIRKIVLAVDPSETDLIIEIETEKQGVLDLTAEQ